MQVFQSSVLLPLGYQLVAFETIGSTNDEAKTRAEEGAPSGTVIWSREQTAGRGRRGRGWNSPPGNLYFTTLLRLPKTVEQPALLSFIAALAIADMVQSFVPAGKKISLKWPNDVLVDGAKISGLLLEADLLAVQPWIVVGIGVNLAFHPPETPYPCTDLVEAGAGKIEPEIALSKLIHRLDYWKNIWIKEGFAPIRQAWLDRAQGLGKPIVARLPNQEIAGVFEDFNQDGALVLRASDGQSHTITAADIFFPSL